MNLKHFLIFLKTIYPAVEITEGQALEVGAKFKEWLIEKFINDMDKLEKIWNIDFTHVVMNFDNPIKFKGYHPALVLHLQNFIKEMQENK